jgi:uncharacterized sulfatase
LTIALTWVKPQLAAAQTSSRKMNILFAIADDQSFPHAGIYGQHTFKTPVFDSIASAGLLFMQAFVAAPQCSPSRAAILTGRNIWQIEEAGTHSSTFPNKFPVFTDALEKAGYHIGFTGKPWAPGNFKAGGWTRNPVGPEYNTKKLEPPTTGISNIDYAANFAQFLAEKKKDQPFFFWYGANEPHRNYEKGSGRAAGYTANGLTVPPFLPDSSLVQNDMLDYAREIEWFDTQLGKILELLRQAGELENTLVVVTSDNGMPFPYAKANMQEYGIHVPMAIAGPAVDGSHRVINNLVSLIDLAPTFLDIAGVPHFSGITGTSLLPLLQSKKTKLPEYVLAGRERHTHARPDDLGYPARAIRTDQYLYIENFHPERWPMGDPPPANPEDISGDKDMKPIVDGYEDIDDSPTKKYMLKNRTAFPGLFALGFEKRGKDELYDIRKDPYCLHDLSDNNAFVSVKKQLQQKLETLLKQQNDPRMTGHGDVFESYPRYGLMRPFPGFRERGKYNPKYQ